MPRFSSISISLCLASLFLLACQPHPQQHENPFLHAEYSPKPLPAFEVTRSQLPAPIFDEDTTLVRMYWKSWELAFRNFHEPAPGSGFVSQFIDAAFNSNIFLWDSCFLTMFCNYGHPHVPGIGTLDNFYAKQHPDGEINREINRKTGIDFKEWVNADSLDLFSRWDSVSVEYRGRDIPQPPPLLTLDALNHPILAWAEWESLQITGDTARIARVYGPLVLYYRALQKYIRQGNGLYMTDWASMDNSPRNEYIKGGGTAVDISSEMVMFADQLADFADLLGFADEAAGFRDEASETARLIREKMWDPESAFFYDLTLSEDRIPVKTVAAYWTLLAGVATETQAEALAAELSNPETFGRPNRVPTLAANEEGYQRDGGYWRGAVWAPTETMVIRGLERYGRDDLARQIALEHLALLATVFRETGTVWENYSAETPSPGNPAKPDFVGWTGIGPILYLIEYAVGLKADALENEIVWKIDSPQRVGAERFWFDGITVDLVCGPVAEDGTRPLRVSSSGAFKLRVILGGREHVFDIPAGEEFATEI